MKTEEFNYNEFDVGLLNENRVLSTSLDYNRRDWSS